MRHSRSVAVAFVLSACSSNVVPEDGGGGQGGTGADGLGGSVSIGMGGAPIASGGASPGNGGFSPNGGAGPGSGGSTTDTLDKMDTTTTGFGGSSSTGPICDSFGGACTSCVSMECSDDWCACTENPECLALLQCFGTCTTQECYTDCDNQHPNGAADAFLVLGCPGCANQCGGQPIDPCTECLYTECEDTLNACVGEPQCLPLWDCLNNCPPGGLTCQSNCYDTYPDGINPLEMLFNCATNDCSNTCN